MGGNVSVSGNSGNVSISRAVRSARSLPVAKVMNSGGDPIRVYLHNEKLEASSFIYVENKQFRNEKEAIFHLVHPKSSVSLTSGETYASVFVQSSTDSEHVKGTISVSSAIPPGRSFIVTPTHEIKLHKEGADNIWLDEDGVDHTPK